MSVAMVVVMVVVAAVIALMGVTMVVNCGSV
jgi:hypothetical protein